MMLADMTHSFPHDTLPFPPPAGSIKSILVIKYDAMGDFAMCAPFFKTLRAFYPDAKILLTLRRYSDNLAELCPYIDDRYVAPEDVFYNLEAARQIGRGLMEKHPFAPFDLVLVPKYDYDWENASFVAAGTGARYRVGYAADCTPFKQKLDTTNAANIDKNYTVLLHDKTIRHEVDYKHRMLQALGLASAAIPPLEIWTSAQDEEIVMYGGLEPNRLIPQMYVTVGIGTTKAFKTWNQENFTQLLKTLLDHNPLLKIAILGSGEYDDSAAMQLVGIFGSERCVSFVDRCSLRQTYLVIKDSLLFIGNDSFCAHAAAAGQVPALVFSCYPRDAHHSNSLFHPQRLHPWQSPHIMLYPDSCGPAAAIEAITLYGPKCVNAISVAAAMTGLRTLAAQENLPLKI